MFPSSSGGPGKTYSTDVMIAAHALHVEAIMPISCAIEYNLPGLPLDKKEHNASFISDKQRSLNCA